jgi:hypothetical protein
MANDNNPCGFRPENTAGLRPPRRYRITADYATSLFKGDPVTLTSGYIVKATAATANKLLGFISHFECEDGLKEGGYYPADSALDWYAFVWDDPATRFIGQDDGDGTDMDLADIGKTGNLIFTHSGNTTTNISGAELDGSSFSGTGQAVTDQLILVDFADVVGNAIGDNAQWVVQIHNHFYRQENNVDAV